MSHLAPFIKAKGEDFVQRFETLEELYSFEKYEEIKKLEITESELKKIPENLPPNLIKFVCRSNEITKIENLPPTLINFNCRCNQIVKIENLPLSLKFFNEKKYIPKSIIDSYINSKITEEEFLSKFPHNINVFKEISDKDFDLSCKICHLEKTTINICSYKDHCFCVDCFCNWYNSHERNCLFCFKKFSL